MFGSKSRSTGIIIGLLIIGLYQGTYFWMQALGRRGGMNPVLAAWIPNLLFGLIGLLLFLRVDRLASRDMWSRLRNRLPFLAGALLIGIVGISGQSQNAPLHLECDDLFISADRSEVIAEGSVHAELEDAELRADSLHMKQDDVGQWRLEATGDVSLDFGDFVLTGDRVIAEVVVSQTGTRTQSLEADGFRGQSSFNNSAGDEHVLYFHGESGRIAFDDDGNLDLVEIRRGELTTCNCCDLPFESQPYTLRANRLLFYPDRMIVAFGLTGRIAGLSTLWLPVYVQPLEGTLGSPLFPAIGNHTLRGWFLKWNVPFFFSESLYGSILFDYFSRFNELGGGLILNYSTERHQGTVNVYGFPAVIGDSRLRFSLDHSVTFSETWNGSASIDYSLDGELESFSFATSADGMLGDWRISSSATRSWKEDGNIVTEQLPRISLSGQAIEFGLVSITPELSASRVREWRQGALTNQATRWQAAFSGALQSQSLKVLGATVAPTFFIESILYSG
ncbi:LptF/LptG family permease, partial [Candidatus Bipolaricaulota bacterium]|nr:LptF/LptG family permease [Candidatus Bipolaricaulota bacterium]